MTWPAAEVTIDAATVQGLVRRQFPSLGDLEPHAVAEGFDNALWRLGDEHVARFPRRSAAVPLLLREVRWLDEVARHLSLATPLPLFLGAPDDTFPWPWSVGASIAGTPGDEVDVAVRSYSAEPLGVFLRELHRRAPVDAPRSAVRGTDLAPRHDVVLGILDRVAGDVDAPAVLERWRQALSAPSYDGPPLWLHGDPHPANTIFRQGRLVGVVDFGDLCAGDPACDLSAGLMSLRGDAFEEFANAYGGLDLPTTWRTVGWTLHFGLMMTSLGREGVPSYERVGALALSNALDLADRL